MNIYCPSCGRSIPSDSKLCAYCGKYIPPGGQPIIAPYSQEKPKEKNILLIIVVVVAILIVASIAIAATVYVYVSGMLSPDMHLSEEASVIVSVNDNLISITLTAGGEKYSMGYSTSEIVIYVNYQQVQDLDSIGLWTIGEPINIGSDGGNYILNGNALQPGYYQVIVRIYNSQIYNDMISIT